MQPLTSIVQTWRQFAQASADIKSLVLSRISKCDTCPNKRQRTPGGTIVTSFINHPANSFYCGICGCPLWSKLKDMENHCPAASPRWTEVVPAESFY